MSEVRVWLVYRTQTATFTVAVASATFLAQCAPANIVGSAVGQKIGTISFNKAFTLQSLYLQDITGYGCCGKFWPFKRSILFD
jgi:hypothetical protein